MILIVTQNLPTLGILTSASVVIAVGAMLFIKRRQDAEDESA